MNAVNILFLRTQPISVKRGNYGKCMFSEHIYYITVEDYVYLSSQVRKYSPKEIFTSAKEVMFSPGFVCGFVLVFVSLFVNKITPKLMDGFS